MNLTPYIGLPFEPLGKGPHGWDCWGLVEHIYEKELGIKLPLYAYDDAETAKLQVSDARTKGVWVQVSPPELFDVVLFTMQRNPHIGLCLGNGSMLHMPRGDASRIESLNSPRWKSRIDAFYRFRKSNSAP